MNGNQNKFDLHLKKVLKAKEISSVTDIQGKFPEDGHFKNVSLAYLAAYYQNYHKCPFLKTLLENGADASYCYPATRHSLLHFAAQKGWENILILLLNNNASISVLDAEGRTPLFMAAKNGHVDCVKTLCNKGADPLLVDTKENLYTPLIIAIFAGHLKVVMIIIVIMKIM